jgi:uncharacterized RDD family membrane protein YckC
MASDDHTPSTGSTVPTYASSGQRLLAALIDWLLLLVAFLPITFAVSIALFGDRLVPYTTDESFQFQGIVLAITLPTTWLYHSVFESSPAQATPGKRLLGLRVTDLSGQRISFVRATLRFLCKMLSAVLCMIGFIWIVLNENRQGLHDQLAGCLVLDWGSKSHPQE